MKTSIEEFADKISNHISKKREYDLIDVKNIIGDFLFYRNELLMKESTCEISGKHYLIEPEVRDLIHDISKEKDYYKQICLKEGLID